MSDKSETVTLAVVPGGTKGKTCVVPGRRFHIADRGVIEFHGDMGFEEFGELLLGLKRVQEKYHLILATAVQYGLKQFGRSKVDSVLQQLEFPHFDATRAMAIGQLTLNFSDSPSLEPDHYWVLASLLEGDEAEQARWAGLAAEHALTAAELKISIEKGEVTRQKEVATSSGRGSGGLGSFEAFEVYFSQFERKIGGVETLLDAPREVKLKFLHSTDHVQEMRDRVKATLEA